MTPARLSIVVVACTAALAATQAPPELPRFRVAIDVVSIDAVVTDRKGDVVRDLTAADFEVLQNGKRQKVTFAQFVPVSSGVPPSAGATGPSVLPAAPATKTPPVPAAPLPPEQVRRTIIVVVDDLGLSVAGMDNARRGLRGFVDSGLLPTDFVAIVRTGESRGLLQPLTNVRAALQAAADALRYNILSRKGVWPSGDVTQVGFGLPQVEEHVSGLQRSLSTAGSLAALNLVVQGARDLPGRKTVIFVSEGFQLAIGVESGTNRDPDPRARYGTILDRVIDQATRSGVVIYAVDGQGLRGGGLTAADDIHSIDPRFDPDAMGKAVRGLEADRRAANRDAQESLAYLSELTGGFAVVNTNDLGAGLRRISNDVRDYYVIGYEPDHDTFTLEGKRPRRHKVAVNVRREGVRVRTRKEFIGVSDPASSGPPTPAQQLVRAAISPFGVSTIALHATNLPGYSPGRGLFVRTVLHLDAQALTFSTNANGSRTATADLVGLVVNSDGAQVDNISTGFDVTLENAAAPHALEHGLVYSVRVPVGKPGGYQLRYAIRDRRSGAIGAVGGFVNVPDVAGGAFALSGLVVRAGDRATPTESIDSDRFSVRPADALRVYAAGTPLSYSYEIYNAGTRVQAVASLWRGTDKLSSLPPDILSPPSGGGPFAAAGSLKLPGDLSTGSYVLQIAATSDDPKRGRNARGAVQRLPFEVR